MHFVLSLKCFTKIAKILLQDGWTPLHIAASKGFLELVELVLETTDAEYNVINVVCNNILSECNGIFIILSIDLFNVTGNHLHDYHSLLM